MKHYQLGLYEKAMPGTLSWREKLETARRTMQDLLHSASARLGGDQDGLGAMTASVSAQLAALQEQLGGMTDFLRETAETLSNVPLK